MGRTRSISVLPLLVASACFAQNATTSLRGVIQDQTGGVVPGAKLTIVNAAAGQTLNVTTNQQGEYALPQMTPARYVITVTAAGFGSQKKEAELLVNQPATISFILGAAASDTVVEVNDTAQTLNSTDATLGNAFNNATIQALPTETRNVPDLLSLQPGVFYVQPPQNIGTQDSRSGAVNGERADQSNVTLDGVDDNDQLRGLAFFGVLRETQDSVQEFRVVTSNANADEGRSSGAQVSMVTKSGTNSYHGAAYEYNRPTNTVSNDYFNKQGQLASELPNRPPKLIRNIFGGDTGGFIVKDRLFFFGNYEGQRLAESQVVSRIAPTALYQQGTLSYQDANGGVSTLTPAQLALVDAGCSVCNTAQYPHGPGANPAALSYLQSMPAANGFTQGDGVNTGSYTFSSPAPQTLNTSIVRLDYTPGSKHRIFGRGNLQKDTLASAQQFPGQPASALLIDNSKGMTFGDTWTISSRIVNDVRYAYVRQGYGSTGQGGNSDFVDFRYLDTPTAETRNTVISVPVNNVVDNLTISEGRHTIGLGGNWRLLHINRSSNSTTFNYATTNPSFLSGTPPSPALAGLPAYANGFKSSYETDYANLVGDLAQVTDTYNYAVTSPTQGSLLGDGAYINRHFKANEFEYYLQDAWQVTPKLNITFGIRHTILQTPYETSGQQVAPTIDTHAWFMQREAAAVQGQIYEPNLSFAPSGPAYGRPGFWPKSKNNIAPRFSIAFAPNPKTSLRAGAGIYYQHYGEGLVNTYDQNGSFGLSSSVSNKAGATSYENTPRFTGRNTLPYNNGVAPATTSFPYQVDPNLFGIQWGLDSKLKTPYTESFDASIQQALPGGFTFEVAYVGRLGRHLLQSLDLAQPVDFTDPQGGGDYYAAAAKLSGLADQHGGDSSASVPAIPYFENVFPYMKNFDYSGESATQAIYSDEWAPYRYTFGETQALADIDYPGYCGGYYCPDGHQSRFWQGQFASLYALSTIGMSYYNAAQFSLRHAMSHGLQADINYTFSKAIDMGSDAERTSEFSNGVAAASSEIINTWKPYLNRAVSDFDTRHLVTIDAVYGLPVGRGRMLLGGSNHLVDAVVGGWQISSIFRATSGLPFSLGSPGWATDWQIAAYPVVTGNLKAHKQIDASGNPTYLGSSDAVNTINNGVYFGNPVRLPYPGETGERNNFRGDGYLNLDSDLDKSWKLGEYGALKFDWAVYNVTNTDRFDPFSINSQLLSGSTLGTANHVLGLNRRMQFALRYDF